MKPDYVLDSWAVMAWLEDERPAADRVDELFSLFIAGSVRLAMSIVNMGELFYLVYKRAEQASATSAVERLQSLAVAALSVSNRDVMDAAAIKARRRVSYADAFALAAARKHAATLVTGDGELLAASEPEQVRVEWIGASE